MAQVAAPAVRIVNSIDESRLVTLKGTVHPLANARNDRGAAPDGMQLDRMQLVLTRSAGQESALRQLIAQMHVPGSPSYHKWLTPDQFGAQFGPSDQDIATVETWLQSHGFSIAQVNPGKQTLEFSGNVGQFRSAFHAQIHKYEVNGETHYANATDPQIPAALAPVVGGFVSLNNFRLRRYSHVLGKAQYDTKTGLASPEWTLGPGSPAYDDTFVLAPQDFAYQYDLNPLYTAGIKGDGQPIAIVNDSNINVAMANQFRTLFGLPANPPQVIIDGNDPGIDGINNPDGPNYDSVEAYLDVEWSGAVAPDATIDLVIAADTALQAGLALAAEHAVYANVAPIISLSFGNCEYNLGSFNQTINLLWEQAAAQGITVIVSTGDNGSAGCDNPDQQYYAVGGQAVNGFASTPFNVAVGGTDFYYSDYQELNTSLATQLQKYWNTTPSNNTPTVSINTANVPIPEQPWNDSQYGLDILSIYTNSGDTETRMAAGSGGASNCATGTYDSNGDTITCTAGYPKPSWQSPTTITGMPSDTVRDLPDVSLFAANGFNNSYYPECYADGDCQPVSSGYVQFTGIGGTSASAPSFAGIMALVDQKYNAREGVANYILYPMYAQFQSGANPPFHDVTVGTNSVPCEYSPTQSADCISVLNPITVTDPNLGEAEEGQIGNESNTTPEYNATIGYDLATGLGTIDANNLVTEWNQVTIATTSTTLLANPTTFTAGGSNSTVTISGRVTGSSPTGSVALMTDSTEPLQQGQAVYTLNGSGDYSGTVNYLPGGTYHIWAQYSGDTNNAPSTSPQTLITAQAGPSTIDFNIFSPYSNSGYFTAGSNPGTQVDYGTQLELSAVVGPSSDASALENCVIGTGSCSNLYFPLPTGPVTFTDTVNGTPQKTVVLLNAEGDAEYNWPFAVGQHSVTASYNGDESYQAAQTTSPITFKVVQDQPSLNLYASILDNTDTYALSGTGQSTAITIVIANTAQSRTFPGYPVPIAGPTGKITITGSQLPGLSNGTYNLTSGVDASTGAVAGLYNVIVPAGTASGNYNFNIAYNGDTNYQGFSATQVTAPIESTSGDGAMTSTTTATVTGSSITPTSAIVVSGTVTGQTGHPAPSGGVWLYASGGTMQVPFSSSSGDVSSYSVALNSQSLMQGANYIVIQFPGDANYNPSSAEVNSNNPISNPLSDFTMVPNTTIVPVSISGGASSNTDTINLASVNGFSGTVNLTCTAALGVTCTISPTAGLSNGGSATATLTIDAPADTANLAYNVLVTGTSGGFTHTLAIEALVSGSPAGSTSYALSNSGNFSIAPGATTGNASTITVTPIGAFTGTVDLNCTVSGPAGATSPATCTLGAGSATGTTDHTSVDITSAAAQTATLTVDTTSTTTAGTYTVTITGTHSPIQMTTTVTVNVGTPSFSFTGTPPNPATITISSPGESGTSTITVNPTNGFTGTVSLSCAVTNSPAGANDPVTCSIPSSVTISDATPQTATLTIYSTAASAFNKPLKLFWPSTGGAVLAVLIFFVVPRRRRSWLVMLGLLVFFVTAAGIGCGGGGGGGGNSSNPGTTTGQYTVAVTGTSGTGASQISQTTNVTVNVN
jgi:hypothetical protein